MTRPLTPRSSLDNLKKEARRWLKALRANDVEARARLLRTLPEAPAAPTLRDVQHALAREYGLAGWSALRARLIETHPRRDDAPAASPVAALIAAAAAGDVDPERREAITDVLMASGQRGGGKGPLH